MRFLPDKPPVKTTILQIIKWFVLLATFSFLLFKLYNFKEYSSFLAYFASISPRRFGWLAVVALLLPINLFLETIKWQKIVEKTERISLQQAITAVLAGFFTGFATPNRIGEMGGRMLFVRPENRKITAIYALLNGFTQNYSIALIGLPISAYYFLFLKNNAAHFQPLYFMAVGLFVVVFTLLYFQLPNIVFLFNKKHKLQQFSEISTYKKLDLLLIVGYSILRFLVFNIQFYAILLFFAVNLSVHEAAISLPVSYLFVTFTPSMAFSEASIRCSYAVFFIGAFSANTVGIALAGFMLWLINFVVPMLIGGQFVAKTK